MRSAFSKPRLDRLSAKFADYVDRGQVPGLVVLLARGDEVHVEAHGKLARNGDAPMQRDSLFRIASLSKPIAAAAARPSSKRAGSGWTIRWTPGCRSSQSRRCCARRMLRSTKSSPPSGPSPCATF